LGTYKPNLLRLWF
jgi:hypothetical protein